MNAIAQSTLQGQYVFSRQEMAAAFEFTANGKFNFYYAYGAVDRTATGSYTIHGNKLTLKSDKEPGHDFTVTKSAKNGTGYSLRFECPETYLVSNIRCTFFIGNQTHEEYTNEKGEVSVAYPHVDKIYVQHTLFPDISTLIKDGQNNNNRFTLSLNPSLAEVSFKGIELKIEDDRTLSCPSNYVIMLDDIKFRKQ